VARSLQKLLSQDDRSMGVGRSASSFEACIVVEN
jgi:hypothetical protein